MNKIRRENEHSFAPGKFLFSHTPTGMCEKMRNSLFLRMRILMRNFVRNFAHTSENEPRAFEPSEESVNK